MNCFEFRRRLLINPQDRDADFLRHKRRCRDCAPEVQRIEFLDTQLMTALLVDAPTGLPSRVLLKSSSSWSYGKYVRYGLRYLLGLAVLLGLGVGAMRYYERRQWDAEVLLLGTQAMMQVPSDASLPLDVQALLTHSKLELLPSLIAHVVYAETLTVRDLQGLRLNFEGQQGPVVAFIFPHPPQKTARFLQDHPFTAFLQPLPRGFLLIFGMPNENLHYWIHQIRRGII